MVSQKGNSDFNWGDEGTDRSEKIIHVLSWVIVLLLVAIFGLYLKREQGEIPQVAQEKPPVQETGIKEKTDISKKGEYSVVVGKFSNKDKAENFAREYVSRGLEVGLIADNNGYWIQIDRFESTDEAANLQKSLLSAGIPAEIMAYRRDFMPLPLALLPKSSPDSSLQASSITRPLPRDIKEIPKAGEKAEKNVPIPPAQAPDNKKTLAQASGQIPPKAQDQQGAGIASQHGSTDTMVSAQEKAPASQITKLLRNITRESPDIQGGRWTVQLGVFSREENVKSLKDLLESKGFEVFILPSTVGQRVQAGAFLNRQESEECLEKLMVYPEISRLAPIVLHME